MEKQKQIQRGSGGVQGIHPRLDESSLQCLMDAQSAHRDKGGNFSQNVIIRRAIRFYSYYLKSHCQDYWREKIETLRAAKGIL